MQPDLSTCRMRHLTAVPVRAPAHTAPHVPPHPMAQRHRQTLRRCDGCNNVSGAWRSRVYGSRLGHSGWRNVPSTVLGGRAHAAGLAAPVHKSTTTALRVCVVQHAQRLLQATLVLRTSTQRNVPERSQPSHGADGPAYCGGKAAGWPARAPAGKALKHRGKVGTGSGAGTD